MENPLISVVNMTIVLESVPSCPMFLAITKQETVEAEPNIIKIATI